METKKIIQKLVISSILLMACFCYNPIFAQVAINTAGTPPDGSAMLDVQSTEKGFLPPRMTEAQRNAINSPVAGLMLWCNNCGPSGELQVYNGTEWVNMIGGAADIHFICGTSTMTDTDGNTYNTVLIGTQCWMAENLNYETANSWWYDNSTANGDVYGRLYTWNAALTACPDRWHLPSDDEWKTLEMYLGMSQSEADQEGLRGTDEGEKLKSTSGWYSGGNGTDAVGFTALPGGYREAAIAIGSYLGYDGSWGSATEFDDSAWQRGLVYWNDHVIRTNYSKEFGYSVRCLRD